jgi:hypothetical protein
MKGSGSVTAARFALAALCLAGAASAQTAFRGWRSDLQVTSNVPGEPLALDPLRLGGDHGLDALLRTSETLARVIGPATFEAYVPFGAGSTAAAVVPRALGDRVAACDAEGLKIWCWSPLKGGFNACPVASASDWRGATDLQVVPRGAQLAFVALAADRKRLLRGSWDGAKLEDEAPIVIGETVRAFAALDFVGDLELEYAVLSAAGLRVFDSSKPLAGAHWPQFGGGERLLRVPSSAGAEKLAYLFESNGASHLAVLSSLGAEPSQVVRGPIADWKLADWDLDGDLDLLLTAAEEPLTFVLYRDRIADNGFTFDLDPSAVWAIPHGPSAAKSKGGAGPRLLACSALGDFDLDGDVDLLGAARARDGGQNEFAFSLVRGDRHDDRQLRPWIGGCSFDPWSGSMDCPVTPLFDATSGAHIANRFDLDFRLSEAPLVCTGVAPTHLEVLCFLQDDFSQFHSSEPQPNYVDEAPAVAALFALPALPCVIAPGVEVPIAGRDDERLVYHFAARAVRVENGVVTRRWPMEIALHRRDVKLNLQLAALLPSERIDLAPGRGANVSAPIVADGSSSALSGGVNERPVIRPTRPGALPRLSGAAGQ